MARNHCIAIHLFIVTQTSVTQGSGGLIFWCVLVTLWFRLLTNLDILLSQDGGLKPVGHPT